MRGLKISYERFEVVYRDISDGSEPTLRFYILVVVLDIDCQFRLDRQQHRSGHRSHAGSTFDDPYLRYSLALVRGDSDLLGRAARAEIVGVSTAVMMTGCSRMGNR